MSQTTSLAALRPEIQPAPNVAMSMETVAGFESMQRIAKLFATSTIAPKAYQGNVADCFIAVDMAMRMGANPLMVMQNLYIVHGSPAWSAQFLIATFNKCGRFSSLRYEFVGSEGEDDWGCRAVTTELATREKLVGPLITIGLAKKEGWYSKPGSKWQTMPEQMLRYRAAAWLVRAYAPEIAMGLHTADEVQDAVITVEQGDSGVYEMTMDELATSSQKPDKSSQRKSGRKNAAQVAPEKDNTEKPDAGPQETTVKPEQADNPDTAASPQAAPLPDDEDGPPIPCPNRNDALVSPDTCFYCEERKGCPAHDK